MSEQGEYDVMIVAIHCDGCDDSAAHEIAERPDGQLEIRCRQCGTTTVCRDAPAA